MKIVFYLLTLTAALIGTGCSGGGDATATKQEEASFRNPSKEPPAGASNIGGGPSPASTK